MKKLLSFLILVPSLAVSYAVLAATQGAAPQCTSGALNLVVVNQLDSDACFSNDLKGEGTYCMVGVSSNWSHDTQDTCVDLDTLYKNENASLSLKKMPDHAGIIFQGYVCHDGQCQKRDLKFSYQNGSATNNCAEVLANSQCTIAQTGDSDHKIYTLTISQ